MIAAIIFCSLAGIVLVLRRKDKVSLGLGFALLVVSALLFWDHWIWLQESPGTGDSAPMLDA